jgi:glucokinase
MVVSTGIGGGLILDGRPVLGRTGNAGHIGHIEVAGITGQDSYGSVTTLESIASGPNSVAWARSQGWQGEDGEDLARSLQDGDAVAVEAVHRAGQALGQAIAGATALLDLEVVAIGGGFAKVGAPLFDTIRAVVAEHYFPYVREVQVVPSGAGEDAPLIGAAALVFRAELLPAD